MSDLTTAHKRTIKDCIDWLQSSLHDDSQPVHNQNVWVINNEGCIAKNPITPPAEPLPDLFDCNTACCLAGYVGVLEYTKKNKDWKIYNILVKSTQSLDLEKLAAEKLGLVDKWDPEEDIPQGFKIFEDYQTRETLVDMLTTALNAGTWDVVDFSEYDEDYWYDNEEYTEEEKCGNPECWCGEE